MFWMRMEIVCMIWILILLLRFCLIMLMISCIMFSSKKNLHSRWVLAQYSLGTYSKYESLFFSPWIIISASSRKTSVSSLSAAIPGTSWRRIISLCNSLQNRTFVKQALHSFQRKINLWLKPIEHYADSGNIKEFSSQTTRYQEIISVFLKLDFAPTGIRFILQKTI